MKEADMQSLFKQLLANDPPERAAVYELKLEKGRALPFDRVYDHQVAGLRQAKHKGLYHKISDTPFNHSNFRFHKQKPLDCMFLKGLDAYVVVMFYKPRETKTAYLIDVDRWVEEKESSDRKSLTEDRAREISSMTKIL